MTDPLFLTDVTGAQTGDELILDRDEGRHAAVVKRIRVGVRVLLADGRGSAIRGLVTGDGKASVTVRVAELLRAPGKVLRWVGVQALAKGDRSDLAIEALTELGVDEILAWQASRSIVRWQGTDHGKVDKGVAKWPATVREATKQSRRFTVPPVSAASTKQVCARIESAAAAFILHEEASGALAARALPATGEVLFIIGPEGGITPDELAAFTTAGAIPVSISDGVLRTSSAGVVALAQLQVLALH